MWAQNFVNGLGIPVCNQCDTNPELVKQMLWADVDRVVKLTHQWPDETFRWKHAVLAKFFMLKPKASAEIQQTLVSLNLGGDYIGIHIRHGDKGIEAALIDSAKYARSAIEAAYNYNITSIFVASDDPMALNDLQNALPSTVTAKWAPRLGDKTYHYEAIGASGSNDANLALLTDVVGLLQSKVFVGTASSNIGRLVYNLRTEDQKQQAISMDLTWTERAGL
ncbi:unnamed protein product [Polarella glacialis]|uniref:Alpha-(1,6)-fucosyltransferase N- and catalytic domain-containing protein n=1 Tax=Polarella glacialis TaxID=89957 RepID=A0A813LXS9_POLGL|nr:unnamed protein product [Polarella glacialis]